MSTKRSRRRELEKQRNLKKQEPEKKQQPRQRYFTEEFSIGDEVAIIRHDHGWEDGGLTGRIVSLSPTGCTVRVSEENRSGDFEIHHCRDIYKVR